MSNSLWIQRDLVLAIANCVYSQGGPTSNGTRDSQIFSMTWQVHLWAAILLPLTSSMYLCVSYVPTWGSQNTSVFGTCTKGGKMSGVRLHPKVGQVHSMLLAQALGLLKPDGLSRSRWNMRVQSKDICRGWQIT